MLRLFKSFKKLLKLFKFFVIRFSFEPFFQDLFTYFATFLLFQAKIIKPGIYLSYKVIHVLKVARYNDDLEQKKYSDEKISGK